MCLGTPLGLLRQIRNHYSLAFEMVDMISYIPPKVRA